MLNIWHRQKGESAKAYEAAKIYFELGAERSLEAVGQRLGKSKAICERWSSRWNWVERAQAYDAHLYVIEQVARDEERAKQAAKWEQRREDIREEGWTLYEALKVKAEQMLRFPVSRTEIKDKNTIILPADWNFNTAARVAETALKLGRLAAELSTENFDIDVSKLSGRQLAAVKRAIQSGQSVAKAIAEADRD